MKSHKDDVEKHKTKKAAQSSCVIGVKKEKSTNDSKKHNESNSKLFILCKNYLIFKINLIINWLYRY